MEYGMTEEEKNLVGQLKFTREIFVAEEEDD